MRFFPAQAEFCCIAARSEKRTTMTIMNVLSLFGGLGLFLFGMQLMGEALEKAAGTRLKSCWAW